jgi:hypothetical protein
MTKGEPKAASDVLDEAKRVASATQLQEFFGADTAVPPPPVPSGDSVKKTTVPMGRPIAPPTKP